MNCDNCLNPPEVWDGTDAARKLLSTIYRIQQSSGMSFGAGHVMDILRGKTTEKVTQYGHTALSTFGIGASFSEVQLRGVLRQLIALGAVAVDAQAFNTLQLTEQSRAVLRGEVDGAAAPIRLDPEQPQDQTVWSRIGRHQGAYCAGWRRTGPLCGSQGLARRRCARTQPARLCDFS
jgi:superfamily II DNA helicase RecQ